MPCHWDPNRSLHQGRDVLSRLSIFPYSLKNPLISVDFIRDWWHWSHPVHTSTSKLTVSSGCVPAPCLHVWPERLHISILAECKCCSCPARVSLLHTCLDGFFSVCILVQMKTLTLNAPFLSPFVWCRGALQLSVLPHYFPILLHLARRLICLSFDSFVW